ncbi:MAG TPA: DUF4231 domain-containing protein [Actinocrinis sp.]|nr:DUF4231 domain-containing protein [Actinocrinis sp.]
MDELGVATEPAGLADADLPELFRLADRVSLAGQRRTILLTRAQLSLAVLSALAAGFGVGHGAAAKVLDLCAVVCFALSLVPAILLHSGSAQRLWYDGRAAAESARSLAWRYAMRVQPFDHDAEADAQFITRLGAVLALLPELADQLESGSRLAEGAITPPLVLLRQAPLSDRRRCYVQQRVQAQIDWYKEKANGARQAAMVAGGCAVASNALGVVLGIARVVWDLEVDLLGFFAALVAALAAYGQLRQYWPLAAAYRLTASELSQVLAMAAETGESESDWSDYCASAEAAVSREHTMWQARR